MVGELPGANVLNVLMNNLNTAMNMATRQVTEAVNTFGAGTQALVAELTKPPALPAGLPQLPALPQIFPTGPVGAPAPAATAAGAAPSVTVPQSPTRMRSSDRRLII